VDVTVQWVRTTWSKRSRGFPASVARSSTPVAFPLPDQPAPLFHEVVMREEDRFEPRSSVTSELPPRYRLSLTIVGDRLTVRLPAGFGVPVRTHRPLASIERGEWLRWQMNNRFSSLSGMGDWHYVLQCVNVGFGAVPRDAFLGEPSHRIDERAILR
jgi:hypothetical protein